MSKLLKITVGYKCNNSCFVCYEKNNRKIPEKTTDELKKEIAAAKRHGSRMRFYGGEATIRTDFIELVKYAKSCGFKYIMLTTNGRMLMYPGFVRQLLDAGISQIIISLHGHKAKIHDAFTNSRGSFKQVIKGIENLKKMGFEQIGINTVITKLNYKYLPSFKDLLLKMDIRRAEFIYLASADNHILEKFAVPLSEAASEIRSILQEANYKNLFWTLLNPPLCCYFYDVMGNISYSDVEDEIMFLHGNKFKIYYRLGMKKALKYIKTDRCRSCKIKGKCRGVEKKYLDFFGKEEIKPVLLH